MLAPGPLDQMVGANKAYMDKMAQTKKDADKLSKAAGIDPDYTKKAVANTMKNAKPNARLRAKFGKKTTENVNDLNQLASSAQQGLQKVKQGDMRGALDNMEQIAHGLAKLDVGTKMYNFMAKMLSAYEQQVANFPEDPDTPKLQKVIDQIQAQMPTMKKQAAQSKQYAKMARNKEVDAFGGLGEKTTVKKDSSGTIRNVQYKDGNVTVKQTARPDSTPGYQQVTYNDPAKGTKYDIKGSPETGYTTSATQKVGDLKLGAKKRYSGQNTFTAQLGKKKVQTTETTTAGAIATVAGNGFANGGPGTIKRANYTKSKKVKNSKKT